MTPASVGHTFTLACSLRTHPRLYIALWRITVYKHFPVYLSELTAGSVVGITDIHSEINIMPGCTANPDTGATLLCFNVPLAIERHQKDKHS